MKHIIIFISIILYPILSYSQTQRAESIVIPVSSMGDVSDTRKQILQNTLEEKLKIFFKLISQERYEEAQEKAFEELDFEECTEDQCIMKIQELLQVENAFHLQIIGEGKDTQLSLSWRTIDEKRKETAICRGCDTFALNERIENLVDKLLRALPSQPSLAQKEEKTKREKEEETKRKQEEEAKRKQEEERKKSLERKIEKEEKLAKQKEEDEKWAKKQSELWAKNDYTGYSLNLLSPLGYPDNQNIKGFRFNLLYGDHENVRGLDLGFVNKSKTFHGVQTTIPIGVNIVTEEMRGLQFNIMGFNYAKKGAYQLGLITMNIAGEAEMQVSLVNWAKSVKGQLSLLNVATDDAGFQFGFFANYAGKANVQIGLLNVAKTLEGNQIGVINIATYSKGCQFGFINLTSKKESGFPLLPFVNCSM